MYIVFTFLEYLVYTQPRIQRGGNGVDRPHLPPLACCIFNLKFDIYVIWLHLYNIVVFI